MSELLEKMGFKKKIHVGISLSVNNFIELVCVDKNSKNVTRYASGNIKYNNAIREIIDFDEFQEVVESLFEEAGLDPKECSVTLNLPNVHFGIYTLESSADIPYITDNIQTELEDLYIFKRNDPVISYSFINSANKEHPKIIYSAIQTNAIGRILEIFDNMQVDVVRIDTSISSFLKSMQYCDRFSRYFEKNQNSVVLLITSNSYHIFYMNANNVVDYVEEPIAIKSFSIDEVYSNISKTTLEILEKYSPSSLLIISETDEVKAELMSSRLNYSGDVDCVNKSVNNSEKFIEVLSSGNEIDENMISYLTIEAVGAAVADYEDYPLNINFMPLERINTNLVEVGGYEVDFYRFVAILAGIAIISALIIGFILNSIFQNRINNATNSKNKTSEEIQVFQRKTNTNREGEKKNIFPTLKKIVDNNAAVITAYNLLSTEIPENVYIKKFVTNSEGGIGILGEAKTSDLADTFASRLRLKNEDLTLSKLSLNSSNDLLPSIMSEGFTFEIKTQSVDVSLNEEENLIQSNIENTINTIRNIGYSSGYGSGVNGQNIEAPKTLAPPPPII